MEYHNLRNFQLPRADEGEVIALAMEAKRLITFLDTQLRQWMIAVKRPLICIENHRETFVNVFCQIMFLGFCEKPLPYMSP